MKSAARVVAFVLIVLALSSIGLLDKADASLLQSPTNPGTTDLVAWWALDETNGTRADSHGGNNLTDNNTVASASAKQSNGALFQQANSEYLSIADNSALSGGDLVTGLTFGAWIYLDAPSAAGYEYVLSKWENTGNQREYIILIYTSTGTARVSLSENGINTVAVDTPADSIATSAWYFVVGWLDPTSHKVNIQINDDAPVVSAGTVAHIFDGSAPYWIGRNTSTSSVSGIVDEAFVYKRALSDDERAWLFNDGTGRRYCEVANNCPEYLTATAAANQTATAAAFTATADANNTATAGALTATATAGVPLTQTAAALTATQLFGNDLQTIIAAYKTHVAALTYTPTVTLTATLTGTPNPLPQFESTISYGDIARTNALACIATIGGLWALVWIVVTFFGKRRRT